MSMVDETCWRQVMWTCVKIRESSISSVDMFLASFFLHHHTIFFLSLITSITFTYLASAGLIFYFLLYILDSPAHFLFIDPSSAGLILVHTFVTYHPSSLEHYHAFLHRRPCALHPRSGWATPIFLKECPKSSRSILGKSDLIANEES